jgi:glycosyltransferase involved in cell wall biosynthesis
MRLAVISDLLEERWFSMDLVADALLEHAPDRPALAVRRVRPRLPRLLERLVLEPRPDAFGSRARYASLAFGRYVQYPLHLLARRGQFDCYHVADHSYGHLVLELPAARSGVYCHDIDAFRPLLSASERPHRRAIAKLLLAGMRRASVVFHSSLAVRDEILAHGLVPEARLRHVPYGVAAEFHPERAPGESDPSPGVPFVLHVGSLIPRKNPDFVVSLAIEICRARPECTFLQIGGRFDSAQRARLERAGVAERVRQIESLTRAELAPYYRSAAAVVLPSLAEGFGLPVVEALACGAPVIVSDIAVLTQVGAEAIVARRNDDLEGFCSGVLAVLGGAGPSRETRLAVAARYSWRAHAAAIVDAYRALLPVSSA